MRKGFVGLATLVQQQLGKDPFGGQLFCFRGRRSHLLKILWWDGKGLVLYAKRLERGRFVWPVRLALGEGPVARPAPRSCAGVRVECSGRRPGPCASPDRRIPARPASITSEGDPR